MLRYLSICSGIEAATAAWRTLGWEASGNSMAVPVMRWIGRQIADVEVILQSLEA